VCVCVCVCVCFFFLVICVLVLTVFCIVCTVFCIVSFMYIYSYLFCLYWCEELPAWEFGSMLTLPHHKNLRCYTRFHKAADLD